MNDVLDTIERELMIAVRRSNVRRRRRRTLGIFGGAALSIGVTAGVGIAGVTGTPIENLLGGAAGPKVAKPADAPRTDLSLLDAGGLRWSVTAYRTANDNIAVTAAPVGDPATLPPVRGANAFAIALSLRDGPLATTPSLESKLVGGERHTIMTGTVDARVDRLVVDVGGALVPATLADGSIASPVELPPAADLTAEGRALLDELPQEVQVRAFAAAPSQQALAAAGRFTPRFEASFSDGTRQAQVGPPGLCAAARCR